MAVNGTWFDLYDVFMNNIFGKNNDLLFIAACLALIAFICAKFRFPNVVTLSMFAIFGIFMGSFFTSYLALILLFIGVLFAWGISRLMTRG